LTFYFSRICLHIVYPLCLSIQEKLFVLSYIFNFLWSHPYQISFLKWSFIIKYSNECSRKSR
jgi:hypothetical protein